MNDEAGVPGGRNAKNLAEILGHMNNIAAEYGETVKVCIEATGSSEAALKGPAAYVTKDHWILESLLSSSTDGKVSISVLF